MLFIFYFGKKARASFICKRFLFPESNDPPPEAANSESNEGRYYRNSTVCRYIPKYLVQKKRKLQHVAFSWLRSSHLTISRDSILRAAKRSDYTGNYVLSGSKDTSTMAEKKGSNCPNKTGTPGISLHYFPEQMDSICPPSPI